MQNYALHFAIFCYFYKTMKKSLYTLTIALFISAGSYAQEMTLYWSDEFDQDKFDEETWVEWDGTAFNNEHQYYTPRDTNIYVEDGYLHIVGLREDYKGQPWTSGRIYTHDTFEYKYGMLEIRAKLPEGRGLWPAFWLLGANRYEVGWPYSGEIDVMEFRGHQIGRTQGTLHFAKVPYEEKTEVWKDHTKIKGEYFLPEGENLVSDFNVWKYFWSDSVMTWTLNDKEFFRVTREEIEAETSGNPFNQPFYIIFNLAIGGNYLGDIQPDESTPDRNELIIDYVRVYKYK